MLRQYKSMAVAVTWQWYRSGYRIQPDKGRLCTSECLVMGIACMWQWRGGGIDPHTSLVAVGSVTFFNRFKFFLEDTPFFRLKNIVSATNPFVQLAQYLYPLLSLPSKAFHCHATALKTVFHRYSLQLFISPLVQLTRRGLWSAIA